MGMLIVVFLIILITAAVYFMNRLSSFKLCPVCAGVSGTWLLLVLGIIIGLLPYDQFRPLILLLMGATAVGIAYQGEKKFKFAQKGVWRWKAPAIIAGLVVFWSLSLLVNWYTFILELVLISVLAYVFFIRRDRRRQKNNQKADELKKKLEECC